MPCGHPTYSCTIDCFNLERVLPGVRLSRLKLFAVSVLVVAGFLRFSALDRQGLWDDESFTLRALGIMSEPMTMDEGAPRYISCCCAAGWQ